MGDHRARLDGGRARFDWERRWGRLARAAGIRPEQRLTLALSGGADSVFLALLLARAVPRPAVRAVHVDHGLRGEESRADARFCEELCRRLGIPLVIRRLELDPEGPSLEARARRRRYGALVEEATRSAHPTILTAHHSDDSLETLLLRWARGTDLEGLDGLRPTLEVRPSSGELGGPWPSAPEGSWLGGVQIVRPLIAVRAAEIRRLLELEEEAWREDGSNADPRFTRNRLRNELLPLVERLGGSGCLEGLRAFGRAVHGLETRLARATAHLDWSPPPYVIASRNRWSRDLGGVIARGELMRLSPAACRRVLWRLLFEGTGLAPRRRVLETIQGGLFSGRCMRVSLPGNWILQLRSDELHLLPPAGLRLAPKEQGQTWLPFPAQGSCVTPPSLQLTVPGNVTLSDGRNLRAELLRPGESDRDVPTGPGAVELDAADLPHRLCVRWAQHGDRFHGLGAPGSKGLTRFLADCGIPREERTSVPLVLDDHGIVWIAGVRPCERRRVSDHTRTRLRLTLSDGVLPGDQPRSEAGPSLPGF